MFGVPRQAVVSYAATACPPIGMTLVPHYVATELRSLSRQPKKHFVYPLNKRGWISQGAAFRQGRLIKQNM
jgi:hypothetical protein